MAKIGVTRTTTEPADTTMTALPAIAAPSQTTPPSPRQPFHHIKPFRVDILLNIDGHLIRGRNFQISQGGIKIAFSAPVTDGTRARLAFTCILNGQLTSFNARVVAQFSVLEGSDFMTSLRFAEPDMGTQVLLAQLAHDTPLRNSGPA